MLLLLGLNETTMMGVMGWANLAMTQRYAHVAARLGGLLWQDDAAEPGTN